MDSIVPYITIEDAQTYFDGRLHAEAWDEGTDLDRNKALITATRMIDRLAFRGQIAEALQTTQWPRILRGYNNNLSFLPNDICIACCELSLNLLDGVDPDLEEETIGTMTDAYATVRRTSDPTIAHEHIRAGIPSVEAWKHLRPWLNDPNTLRIQRV